MFYNEYHTHRWAKNLAHARKLYDTGQYEKLYLGENLKDNEVFPGLRAMAAHWAGMEQEMPLRLKMLIKGTRRPDFLADKEINSQTMVYADRFVGDMMEIVLRDNICSPDRVQLIKEKGLSIPEDWGDQMRKLQADTEKAMKSYRISSQIFESWLDTCLRSIANYNRYIAQSAVITSLFVLKNGENTLKTAIDATAEEFMWEVSRSFYTNVLPNAGITDIQDQIDTIFRGTNSDRSIVMGEETQDGKKTIRRSILKNCMLFCIYQTVAEKYRLQIRSVGYGICRFCEAQGQANAMISQPSNVQVSYQRVQSLAIENRACTFDLITIPGNDTARVQKVQEKVFGKTL